MACPAPPAKALVVLADISDPAVLGAARQALQQLATALSLSAAPPASAAPGPAPPRPILGLTNLAAGAAQKPVLQVRCRPGPFVLRDFHAAVARLTTSGGAVSSATAAAALQQLVGVVAQDPACAAAGPSKAVLVLTDRVDFSPDDYGACLEVCRAKGVQVEMVFMAAGEEGGDGGGGPAVDALAAAWGAAEALFPHLSVTIVPGASKLSFDSLASSLLQRFEGQRSVAVNLQFKQALVGSIRALSLTARSEIRPLAQAVAHATLCPCHRTPTGPGTAACTCAVSGQPLDRRQCGRDERTVQVGGLPGGALHLAAPFNIASASGGGGGVASLSVVARIKADAINPALLFGVPLLLEAAQPGQCIKVVHDGEMADVTMQQLLGLVCSSLSSAGEALLASCTTDLESGAAGLFRLHYLLMPCEAGAGPGGSSQACDSAGGTGMSPLLCAKRVASAEELLAPLLEPQPAAAAAPVPSLPPAVAEAVAAQLGRVPLEARLDPLALSSRCGEIVEMLVRESQPLPKVQMPAAPPAAPVPAQPAAAQPAAPQAGPTPQQAGAAPLLQGRRPAATAAAARITAQARESGGQRAAGGKSGKGGLELKRTTRR